MPVSLTQTANLSDKEFAENNITEKVCVYVMCALFLLVVHVR